MKCMQNIFANKIETLQNITNTNAMSVFDSSSQSESLQRKADLANNAVQRAEAPRPNNTGMPDNLKSGIESLSGFSMDDVRVHYNSSKPATVQALAYTQGTDIHVAPGQEKCLPHEAWHVAQQMAGRVSPTTNINGMPVNDNAGLEHEADVMGEKALQSKKNWDRTKALKNISLNAGGVQRYPKRDEIINKIKSKNVDVTFNDSRLTSDQNPTTIGQPLLNQNETVVVTNKLPFSNKVIDVNSTNYNKIEALQWMSKIVEIFGNFANEAKSENQSFFVEISVSYNTRKTKTVVNLKMVFCCSKNGIMGKVEYAPGYITKVTRSHRSTETANISNVHNKRLDELNHNEYSSTHEIGTGDNDLELIKRTYKKRRASKLFGTDTVDAYTKLVAEGARFHCVRNNMDKIKDNTFFYITDPIIVGVKFSNLWSSWSSVFSKKYGIDNQTVSEKIKKCVKEGKDGYIINKSKWNETPEKIEATEKDICLDPTTTSKGKRRFREDKDTKPPVPPSETASTKGSRKKRPKIIFTEEDL